MSDHRSAPPALNAVAVLFLLLGLAGVAGTIFNLTRGSFHIDLDLLGIPIFFGIRRFSRGWRTCALVFIWIGLIMLPFGTIASLLGGVPVDVRLFGWRFHEFPPLYFALICIVLFPIVLWQYRVLTRPEIRTLFYVSSEQPTA